MLCHVRTMPEMLTELDKPTDLRVYTIAQVSTESTSHKPYTFAAAAAAAVVV